MDCSAAFIGSRILTPFNQSSYAVTDLLLSIRAMEDAMDLYKLYDRFYIVDIADIETVIIITAKYLFGEGTLPSLMITKPAILWVS